MLPRCGECFVTGSRLMLEVSPKVSVQVNPMISPKIGLQVSPQVSTQINLQVSPHVTTRDSPQVSAQINLQVSSTVNPKVSVQVNWWCWRPSATHKVSPDGLSLDGAGDSPLTGLPVDDTSPTHLWTTSDMFAVVEGKCPQWVER